MGQVESCIQSMTNRVMHVCSCATKSNIYEWFKKLMANGVPIVHVGSDDESEESNASLVDRPPAEYSKPTTKHIYDWHPEFLTETRPPIRNTNDVHI